MQGAEFSALRSLSARVGGNPLLVQAAGGNTSIKQDGVMWIKASGTWLRDAAAKDIFVPLDLASLTAALQRDDPACESCTDFVRHDLNSSGLRPSIETSVHGLMPQKVVVHVHCVNTIAWMVQEGATEKVTPLLAGLDWAFVPYARPGLQLARAIRRALTQNTNILLLQNHGLAVASDTMADAELLLREVVTRLQRPAAPTATPDIDKLQSLAADSDYAIPADANAHGLALLHWAFKPATSSVFYPDHAVFLGVEMATRLPSDAPAVAIEGVGVLVHRKAKPAVEPMLGCLSDVFRRLTPSDALKPLTRQEIAELLNWDAEKYRQSLKQP